MDYGSSISIIGDFVKITFVENPGMAFGIDVGDSKLWLSLFSLVASIGILFYLYKVRDKSPILKLALALIFAGAVGNLIDRFFYGIFFDYAPLFYGKVVDFINVEFFDFTLFGHTYERWPIFNIADASVTVGVFVLILFNRKIEKFDETKKLEEESESLDETGIDNKIESERADEDDLLRIEKDQDEKESIKSKVIENENDIRKEDNS